MPDGHIDGLDRLKRLGQRDEHRLTCSAELDTGGGPGKQPTPSRLLKLSNALTDRARCEREFMRGLLHLSGACHRDKGLQQREASDHGASLAQLNLVTKSIACWSSVRGRYRRDRIITLKGPSRDRHHLAPLRHFSLCGESSDRAWPQGPCLGIGRASRHHAETESDGADGALPLASPISPPIIRFGSCDRISDRRRRRSTAFRGS